MFAPHSAQIEVARTEPERLDLEAAIKAAKRRNGLIAIAGVTKFRLRGPVSKERRKKAQEKIKALWERELRLPYLKDFIESWNHWRNYYDEREYHQDWEPKNRAQLTLIENIIDLAKENELSLDIFIACGFKAFARSKAPLNLQFLFSQGLEFFDRYCEDVNADQDRDEQERRAEVW